MIGHVLVNTDEIITNDYTYSHKALDLVGAGRSTSDVISLEDGIVELVVSSVTDTDRSSKGTASYGNFVKIRHANGQKTLYAHLKYGSVTVKEGENITKGEKIGTMGATGNTYGIHLHFEVRKSDETRENPYEYLWGYKKINPVVEMPINAPPEVLETPGENVNEKNETPENITENIKKQSELISKNEIPNERDLVIEPETKVVRKAINSYQYFSNKEYVWCSIVDALKDINVDSSFNYRFKLAIKNGIQNYCGTENQNLKLLELLKNGKLLKA